jgi:glycosyltransferase involved in cell wall biosynthesis
MKVSIVIPCYNEENMIAETISKIDSLVLDKQIIVVDDGSEDRTFDIVKNNFQNVILLRHRINLGKGAALKTGCEAAIKLGADIIVLLDGDGQHQPEVIPQMVDKLQKENLDIIFASRKFNTQKMPHSSLLGNIFFTNLIKFFSRIKVDDVLNGFRAFKVSVYPKLIWEASDYSVETEVIMNTAKNKLKYGQFPIDTIYYDAYKGTTPFTGVKILFNLLKQKFL